MNQSRRNEGLLEELRELEEELERARETGGPDLKLLEEHILSDIDVVKCAIRDVEYEYTEYELEMERRSLCESQGLSRYC